MAGWLTDQLNN